MSKRASRYNAIEWTKKLHKRGITTYFFPDLPTELKNLSLHIKASNEGFVSKTGYGRKYSDGEIVHESHRTMTVKQYKVNPAVMNLTYSNQKV